MSRKLLTSIHRPATIRTSQILLIHPTSALVCRLIPLFSKASTASLLSASLHTSHCTPKTKVQAAAMSSMPATHGHSAACCNIPPIVSSKEYKPKGKYEELDGNKTYVTGPDSAAKGILVITDIFGFFPQTLQGSDILGQSDDNTKYKVVVPDLFHGKPCPIEWYPPDTDDKQEKLSNFFKENAPASVPPRLPSILKAAEKTYPNIKSWAIVGFCWGGKVVSLTLGSSASSFKVGAECHPAMVESKDAEAIKVPLCMLASKDEDADEVKKFESNLKGTKHVEIFKDQIHGWMGARGDLDDEKVKKEYVRGYKTVLEFFGKNWQS